MSGEAGRSAIVEQARFSPQPPKESEMDNGVGRVPDGTGFSQAAEMIAAERQRQKEQEGWSTAHDRMHRDRELVSAGMIYLHWGTGHQAPLRADGIPSGWPWAAEWFKPKDRIRNLVRAGALFMAENDRLLERPAGYFSPDNWKPHLYDKYFSAVRRLAKALCGAEGNRPTPIRVRP